MKPLERDHIRRRLKTAHRLHVSSVPSAEGKCTEADLGRIRKVINDLLRKEVGSVGFLDQCQTVAREIGAFLENIKQGRLRAYQFELELRVLNELVRLHFDRQKQTRYGGMCASYGELLMNCYLDVYVRLTVVRPTKLINTRPLFMTNPDTGLPLELDVHLEDFRIAFEFQGDHHYTSISQMVRDKHKFNLCNKKNVVLVPVNVGQLSHADLSTVIVNTVKDSAGLHDTLVGKATLPPVASGTLGRFRKLCDRMHLATAIFGDVLAWLDEESRQYQIRMVLSDSRSALYPAPTTAKNEYLGLDQIHQRLRLLR